MQRTTDRNGYITTFVYLSFWFFVLPSAIVLTVQSLRVFFGLSAAYLKVFPSSLSIYKAPFLNESDNCLHVLFLEGADILFFHFVPKLNVSSQMGFCCITA